MQTTLVILAAGMASRYGSMKQVEGFGPGGETIMDYSVYDAIRAGFNKVVFVIRRDFAEGFQSSVGPKLNGRIDVEYVYQEMDAFLDGHRPPPERTKPWGTAHAVLCAKDVVTDPFVVINADDFYGFDAFKKAHGFLTNECRPDLYAILGYELIKTLSDHGSVSRGVCEVDEKGFLKAIKERTNIYRENGMIVYEENAEKHELSPQTTVSMNFFGFHPSLFELTERLFKDFLKDNITKPKAEFFIPIVADAFIQEKIGKIKVIPTPSQWFGVTYKEDAPGVESSLRKLIESGEYPERLWQKFPSTTV
jgi:NDP-sugar pyrophosphorylase family protein